MCPPKFAIDIPTKEICAQIQLAAFAAGYRWYKQSSDEVLYASVAKVLFFEKQYNMMTYANIRNWRPDCGTQFTTLSVQQALDLFRNQSGNGGIDCTVPE